MLPALLILEPLMARRLSLTKSQLKTAAGQELLALLQSIAADGAITDEEVAALREWVAAHRADDLPSVELLDGTLTRALADGVLSEGDRAEIVDAMERVMPPDERLTAQRARVQVEAKKRDAEEEEWTRSQGPMGGTFEFHVAGATRRQHEIIGRVGEGQSLRLVRDPANRFSPNAVEVQTEAGAMIGYVPERTPTWSRRRRRHGPRRPVPRARNTLVTADHDEHQDTR